MQAVFRLLIHDRLRPVGNFCGNFFAAVYGHAVHEHRILLGESHRFFRHAVGGKLAHLLFVGFVVHGQEYVGINDVRAAHRFRHVVGDEHVAELHAALDDLAGGAVSGRAGDGDVHVHLGTTHDEGICHIVSVSDVGDFQVAESAFDFPYGEQVGEDLQGVRPVGYAVDDGDAAAAGKFIDLRFGKGAQHQRGDAVSSEHDRRVLDALAAGDLRFAFGQENVVAAQLADAYLKGNARAGGYLVEQQRNRLVFQNRRMFADVEFLFQSFRQVQKFKYILRSHVGKAEQMTLRNFIFR